MRTGVVTLALAFVVGSMAAGCGGGGGKAAETTPSDPGRETMSAFVDAASQKDAEGMWALLSKPSRRRVGPTFHAFAAGKARELERTLAPFAGGKLPVVVSENVTGTFGLVALSRGGHAYAVPFRRERGTWRIELPGSLRLSVLGPPPGSRGKFVRQIGVESHGPGGAEIAVLYLDGVTLDSHEYPGPKSATVFANFESNLVPGRHTAVAFVSGRGNAAARAWTFFP